MEVNFKKLNKYAHNPTRGSDYAAGYDLYAAFDSNKHLLIPPHETVKIGTGIAMSLPNTMFGAIFARSGIATKRGLRPANAVGVIDADYTGEIIVALHNDTNEVQEITGGERIAQLVIIPYAQAYFCEVRELEETKRGDGGFGSTDQIPGQMSIDDYGVNIQPVI